MDGHIFTTRGWLPAERIELRETVTADDETHRAVRTDKYLDGVWVGNDVHVHMKTGLDMALDTATF